MSNFAFLAAQFPAIHTEGLEEGNSASSASRPRRLCHVNAFKGREELWKTAVSIHLLTLIINMLLSNENHNNEGNGQRPKRESSTVWRHVHSPRRRPAPSGDEPALSSVMACVLIA
ncbi:MAG: hypothetical protein DWQ04_17925 [Chloroflexi bacterium]|nr:MAG: hypothetical protein DWQ04_17925 [Chloroflexota bacterium]